MRQTGRGHGAGDGLVQRRSADPRAQGRQFRRERREQTIESRISLLASLGGIAPAAAICCATGNTARMRGLDGGLIAAGRAADLMFMDRAQHSAGSDMLDSIVRGDIPGIGMVMIDGITRCGRSRNTPPAERVPSIA